MTLSRWFALGGSLLQIGGFVTVVMASTYELAREYSEYGPLGKLWLKAKRRWLYWFGTITPPKRLSRELRADIKSRATLTRIKSPETDVERLTREIAELRTRFEGFQETAEERLGALDERVSSLDEHFTERADTLQGRLDAIHRGALRKERRGALTFVLGTALVLVAAFV